MWSQRTGSIDIAAWPTQMEVGQRGARRSVRQTDSQAVAGTDRSGRRWTSERPPPGQLEQEEEGEEEGGRRQQQRTTHSLTQADAIAMTERFAAIRGSLRLGLPYRSIK